MLIASRHRKSSNAGFTLVELMVALVVGLIVIGAVLALVVSIIRSNNQTIQSTRLTQELRATLAIITNDLKRARGVNDPMTVATAAGGNLYGQIVSTASTDPAGCIRYGYEGAAGGPYHVVRLANGKIELAAANSFGAAACTLAGQQLSSAQVNIDQLIFDAKPNGRQIDITIRGQLAGAEPGLAGLNRSMTQTVYVRSVAN